MTANYHNYRKKYSKIYTFLFISLEVSSCLQKRNVQVYGSSLVQEAIKIFLKYRLYNFNIHFILYRIN